MAPVKDQFGVFTEEKHAGFEDVPEVPEHGEERSKPLTEEKLRSRQLEKAFQSWKVDKQRGCVPPSEISQVVSTFRGGTPEERAQVQNRWAAAVTSEYRVVLALRDSNPLKHIGISKVSGSKVSPNVFVAALLDDITPNTSRLQTAAKDASQPQYMRYQVEARHISCIECPMPPDFVMKRSSSTAESILSDDRSGPPVAFTLRLDGLQAAYVVETEQKIMSALHSETSSVGKAFFVDDISTTEAAQVPPDGVSKRDTKRIMLEMLKGVCPEAFEEFSLHILTTLDFVYDLSLESRRSRVLWELFKEWDTKGHGFIDKSDLLKRLTSMRFFLDRGVDVIKVVNEMGYSDDVSLTEFTALLQQLMDNYSEEQVHEVVRTLKHQLQGDDDIRDTNYAVNKYLQSEIQREQKREERMRQLAERRQSWSGSVIAMAKKDVARGRIDRLESERRHAFDSIAFDDVTSLLETRLLSPGQRVLFEQVANATCLLVDAPPVVVEGRMEYWAALREMLRRDMPGTLQQLRDLTPQSVSLVRVRKVMSFLYLNESDPSNVLRHSWFLSALCRWCHVVANLACVYSGWEWPPAPLPMQASGGGSSVSSQGTASTPSSGGGLSAARSINPSSARPRPTSGGIGRRPQRPLPPRPGTAGGSRPGGRSNKLMGTLSGCCVATPGKTTTRQGSIPVSPFPASDLFIRKRHANAPGWESFYNKVQKEVRAEQELLETAAHQVDTDEDLTAQNGGPVLNDDEAQHLNDMLLLNAELGLPEPRLSEFVGGQQEYSASYWEDAHEEDA